VIDLFEDCEDIRLCGWYSPDETSAYTTVKAHLYNELMERLTAKHYLGDMFHDALWLEAHLNEKVWQGENFSFVWITREWGTHIGIIKDDASPIFWSWLQNQRSDLTETYVITVWNDAAKGERGYWKARFLRLAKVGK
jgi:hypothetical protein